MEPTHEAHDALAQWQLEAAAAGIAATDPVTVKVSDSESVADLE